MFIVVNAFLDLKDNEHLYEVGDAYPRDGIEPSEERIKELLGSDNLQGQPMIKAVKTVPVDVKSEETAVDGEPSEETAVDGEPSEDATEEPKKGEEK